MLFYVDDPTIGTSAVWAEEPPSTVLGIIMPDPASLRGEATITFTAEEQFFLHVCVLL